MFSAGVAGAGGDLFAALGIGGDVAAETGALTAADLGILGAPAVADIGAGATAAGDVLGAGALGAGVGDVSSLFADPAVAGAAEGLTTAADAIPAVGAGFDALGQIGGDVLGPELGALGSTSAGDVAALTPGATSLGGGAVGAVGGATGAPMSATTALEAAANPEDLLAVSSGSPVGGADLTGVGATDAARGGLVENLPADLTGGGAAATPQIPGTFGQSPSNLLPGPSDNASFNLAGGSAPGAGASGGSVAGGGGLGAGTAGVLGDIGSSMDTALTAMPPEELAGGPGVAAGGVGGGGGLFGTGISGSQAALYGLAGAPLAYSLLKGEPGVPPQANQATALSPQEQALAAQMMTSVQQNRPTGSQAAVVAQNSQNRLNAARQALFNQGVQNPEADSRWAAIVEQDQQQQLVETQQFMQQNMADAMAAAGGAQSGLLSVAQMQAQQDAAYTQALQNAMKSAGTVLALGGAFGSKPNVNMGPQLSLG